jgi:hypothetical protein
VHFFQRVQQLDDQVLLQRPQGAARQPPPPGLSAHPGPTQHLIQIVFNNFVHIYNYKNKIMPQSFIFV